MVPITSVCLEKPDVQVTRARARTHTGTLAQMQIHNVNWNVWNELLFQCLKSKEHRSVWWIQSVVSSSRWTLHSVTPLLLTSQLLAMAPLHRPTPLPPTDGWPPLCVAAPPCYSEAPLVWKCFNPPENEKTCPSLLLHPSMLWVMGRGPVCSGRRRSA